MKKIKWRKFIFEFLSIFIAVISAFGLTNWSNNRNNKNSELKILTEIKNGIGMDKQDFKVNITGHNLSLKANHKFRELLKGKSIREDSVEVLYTSLFRDYTAVINGSGYESLKEAGLKTISNDTLRFQIISLYDYYYGIIQLLDEINEMQSFENYFEPVNSLLHPYMEFDDSGDLVRINSPDDLSTREQKEILSYLWRLEKNRNYKLDKYKSIIKVMDSVRNNIEIEINNNS
ncbi:hypothetical protein SAMN05661096_03808 [Marivirga sericea]|uniref:Uncharacterized protein n=1 Tax=Marivirga sericea TaxID=1028 RepID=A0A1X7LET6_9BACT|nr:hypothetical protein [Marivirga sericea]SMG51689.1 hypothetical protein SAMN05661096_03808 [Marivirga sericea]